MNVLSHYVESDWALLKEQGERPEIGSYLESKGGSVSSEMNQSIIAWDITSRGEAGWLDLSPRPKPSKQTVVNQRQKMTEKQKDSWPEEAGKV